MGSPEKRLLETLTLGVCSCGSKQYVYWLPSGSQETWSKPKQAPPRRGEEDPRCYNCNCPWFAETINNVSYD